MTINPARIPYYKAEVVEDKRVTQYILDSKKAQLAILTQEITRLTALLDDDVDYHDAWVRAQEETTDAKEKPTNKYKA